MENCEFCNSPAHNWIYCPKKPDGWRPARLAKKSTAPGKDRVISGTRSQPGYAGDSSVIECPSRDAEVVGLIPTPSRINAVAAKAEQVKRGVEPTPIVHTAGTQALPVDTPKRGRPRIHPDRKAYKAMKEREYRKRRAKQKEEGK